MSKLTLYYPVKPLHVNQTFGASPSYYAKFGLSGHNGIDFQASHGQPVFAAHDGTARYEKDDNGGEGVVIYSDQPYDYQGGTCYFKSIYWHLCDPINEPKYASPVSKLATGVGMPVKAGDLIGYADNTGAPYESSGDHLHFGLKPVMPGEPVGSWYNISQKNGFQGAIDPQPYFSGYFAQDLPKIYTLELALIQGLQSIVSYFQQSH